VQVYRYFVRLSGMHAVHAARALQTALSGLPGVLDAEVRLGEAVIAHDGELSERDLRNAVIEAGLGVLELVEERRRRLPLLE